MQMPEIHETLLHIGDIAIKVVVVIVILLLVVIVVVIITVTLLYRLYP